MAQQDQQVTVRLLPDGEPCPATLDKISGHLLTLDFSPGPSPAHLNFGDLVEVTSPATLYLGVVRDRQAERIAIAVEHALDRETLATIQQVWHGPINK